MSKTISEIEKLAIKYAKECYRDDALCGKSEAEIACLGIGQALAKIAQFNGGMISTASSEAFEDANYHSKAEEIRSWGLK